MGLILAAILAPIFASAKWAARHTVNLSNLKAIGNACLVYAEDFGDRFPKTERWMDSIDPYSIKLDYYRSPMRTDGAYGYAMNSDLSAELLRDVEAPATTILFYETRRGGRNCSRPAIQIPADVPLGREGASIGVAFSDGHAKYLTPSILAEAVLHPNPPK